jgi:GNAT superfamily N-acetyltransferase
VVATAEYQTATRRAEKLRNPELLAAPGAWLLLREDGVDAACLFAVADGRHCGLFDLATRPEFRRRGLGERIIRAAAHWAAGQGADILWSQVAATNAPSLALQRRVGLWEAYRYRYLLKPVPKA